MIPKAHASESFTLVEDFPTYSRALLCFLSESNLTSLQGFKIPICRRAYFHGGPYTAISYQVHSITMMASRAASRMSPSIGMSCGLFSCVQSFISKVLHAFFLKKNLNHYVSSDWRKFCHCLWDFSIVVRLRLYDLLGQ